MSTKNISTKYELKYRPVVHNQQAYKDFFDNYLTITKKPKKFYTIGKPKQKGQGTGGGVRVVSASQDALERAELEKEREKNTKLQIPSYGLMEAQSLSGFGKQRIKKSHQQKRKTNHSQSRLQAKRPKVVKKKKAKTSTSRKTSSKK